MASASDIALSASLPAETAATTSARQKSFSLPAPLSDGLSEGPPENDGLAAPGDEPPAGVGDALGPEPSDDDETTRGEGAELSSCGSSSSAKRSAPGLDAAGDGAGEGAGAAGAGAGEIGRAHV